MNSNIEKGWTNEHSCEANASTKSLSKEFEVLKSCKNKCTDNGRERRRCVSQKGYYREWERKILKRKCGRDIKILSEKERIIVKSPWERKEEKN